MTRPDSTFSPMRQVLVCRVGSLLCALPIEHVAETLRPLPVEPLGGMPAFVLGLSTVRGRPVPVIDGCRLLGVAESLRPTRFVTIKVGERRAVLAVDAVVGIHSLACASLGGLPPLLREASAEAIAAVGTLDADLLVVLGTGSLVPEAVWTAMSEKEAPL